eukprot:TRINITY_DN99_c0_g1_i2.p1 TRINITY_DN99_c0_g1~~TRINITY_DN99_c0_g1_i2.p1  ORF type:complete len:659 (+),score=90.46 TRINITY_DN99_c0_g1_i2:50-2026(+)
MSSLDKLGDREQFYVGEIKRLEEEIAAIQAGTSELTKDAYATIAKLQEEYSKAYRKYRSEETKDAEIDMELAKEKLNKAEANRKDTIASAVSSLKDQIHEYSEIVKQLGTQATPVAGHSEEAQQGTAPRTGPRRGKKKRKKQPQSQSKAASAITPLSQAQASKKQRGKSPKPVGPPALLDERVVQILEKLERAVALIPERVADAIAANQSNSSPPHSLSRSQYIDKLHAEHRLTETEKVDFWYQEEDEKKEKRELEAWAAIIGSSTHTEAAYQDVWNECLEAISKTSKECKVFNTHNSCKRGAGKLHPDLTIVKKNIAKPSPHNAVAYIELKARDTPIRQGEQLGQAVQYLEQLMVAQQTRATAYCILTNGKLETLVMKCERTQTGSLHFTKQEVAVDEPWRCLVAFVKATPRKLGAPCVYTVGENKFVAGRQLGRGRSGTVYEVCAEEGEWATKEMDRELVLKMFTDGSELAREVETLKELANVQGVTSVVAHDAKSFFIVLRPRGRHFSTAKDTNGRFKVNHAKQLYDVLRAVHNAGYVHRDVRPTNFYLLDGEKVVLGDWVDAVPLGETVGHAGVRLAYLPPQLREVETYIATPKQDFYSFVLSCWELTAFGTVTSDLGSKDNWVWSRVLTQVLDETKENEGAFWDELSPLLDPN